MKTTKIREAGQLGSEAQFGMVDYSNQSITFVVSSFWLRFETQISENIQNMDNDFAKTGIIGSSDEQTSESHRDKK